MLAEMMEERQQRTKLSPENAKVGKITIITYSFTDMDEHV
jgi:hypothetical protein